MVEDNRNDRGRFVACLLRLAGHDFMDFRLDDDNVGGSDGCMSFDDGDNKGLPSCLKNFGVADIMKEYEDDVSLADFVVIAAESLICRASTNYNSEDPYAEGTFCRSLLDGFKYGRKTVAECEWNVGRMPNPEHGCHGRVQEDGTLLDGLQQIFVDNIFANYEHPWTLVAAISGVHTVGKASVENSGYEGHWSSAEQQGKFNNDYYFQLLSRGWGPDLAVHNNTAKN